MKTLYIIGKNHLSIHYLKRTVQHYDINAIHFNKLNEKVHYGKDSIVYIDGRTITAAAIDAFIQKKYETSAILNNVFPYYVADNFLNIQTFFQAFSHFAIPTYYLNSKVELHYYLKNFTFPVYVYDNSEKFHDQRLVSVIQNINDQASIAYANNLLSKHNKSYVFKSFGPFIQKLVLMCFFHNNNIYALNPIETFLNKDGHVYKASEYHIDNKTLFKNLFVCIKDTLFNLNVNNIYTFELLIYRHGQCRISNFYPSFSIPGILHTKNMKFSQFDYFLKIHFTKDLIYNTRVNNYTMYISKNNVLKINKELQNLRKSNYHFLFDLIMQPPLNYILLFAKNDDQQLNKQLNGIFINNQ